MKKFWLWVPVALVAVMFAVFAAGLLSPSDRTIASGMVGRPLPEFALQGGLPGDPPLLSSDMIDGKPHIINLFASWCVPCVAEVPVLLAMQKNGVEITGIAIRERPDTLGKFLGEHGNPYTKIGYDSSSRIQILFGSTGVPETYIVDGKGLIVYQHIGVIAPDDVPMLLTKMEAAR